jgi:hypothetical protein
MHNSLKINKTLLYSYSAVHVSGTLAPIQLWSVTTVAIATVVTDQSWKIQPTQRHEVTGGCMCRIRRLLMMGARVPETCRAE